MTGPVKVISSTADLDAAAGIPGIRKAISAGLAGGVVGASAALTTALPDGITGAEWITIGSAFIVGAVVAGFAAYAPPNDVKPVVVVDPPAPAAPVGD